MAKKEPKPYKPAETYHGPPFDAVVSLENELSVLLAWRTRLVDQSAYDRNERDIEKIKAHIDRRLTARNQPTRYGVDNQGVQWDGSL